MAKMIPLYSLSTHAEIEQRARILFERGGRPPGRDLDHWLQAEADCLEMLLGSRAGDTASFAGGNQQTVCIRTPIEDGPDKREVDFRQENDLHSAWGDPHHE